MVSSIYLAVNSDRNRHNKNTADDEAKQEEQVMMIKGMCVICFEDYKIGDAIVWSENVQCNHVYHLDCMVEYLAQNSKREKHGANDIVDSNNPCPTCRRTYCAVTKEDVEQILVQKTPSVPSEQTTNNTNDGDDNNNNDNNSDDDATSVEPETTADIENNIEVQSSSYNGSTTTATGTNTSVNLTRTTIPPIEQSSIDDTPDESDELEL